MGSKKCTKSVLNLAKIVIRNFKIKPKISWYGDPDNRSYNVDFKKLKSIKFNIMYNLDYGVKEMLNKLRTKKLKKTNKNITLNWYKHLNSRGKFLD